MSEVKIISHEVSEETQEAKIVIEIDTDEITSKTAGVLLKIQREAKIPGFRPGKAPLPLVQARFGKDALVDALDEIAKKKVDEAIKLLGIRPGGTIEMDAHEFTPDQNWQITLSFPLFPEPKLTTYKGLPLVIDQVTITDEDIENELLSMRRAHARLVKTDEPASADCTLTLKVTEVDHSGLPLIGRQAKEIDYQFGLDALGIGSDEQLVGIRRGETRIIHITERDSNVPLATRIVKPGHDSRNENAPNKTTYRVEAFEVEKQELPELDHELMSKYAKNVKDVDEFKLLLKDYLQGIAQSRCSEKFSYSVMKSMIKANPYPMSREYIRHAISDEEGYLKLQDKKQLVNDAIIDAHETVFRWAALSDLVIKEANITEEDPRFKSMFEHRARQENMEPEEFRKSLKKETLTIIKERLFEDIVIDEIAKNAELQVRKLSWLEFISEYNPSAEEQDD